MLKKRAKRGDAGLRAIVDGAERYLREAIATGDCKAARDVLTTFESHFRASGENAFYAWTTYAICRKCSVEIPEWVLRYFDGCIERLMSAFEDGAAADADKAVAIALGFRHVHARGRRPAFADFKRHRNELILAAVFRAALAPSGDKRYLALECVSRATGLSERSVRRAVKKT